MKLYTKFKWPKFIKHYLSVIKATQWYTEKYHSSYSTDTVGRVS